MSDTPAPTSHALPVDVRDKVDALVQALLAAFPTTGPRIALHEVLAQAETVGAARAALDARLLALVEDAERIDYLADKVLRVSSSDDDEWEIALFSNAEHPEERIITAGSTLREAIDAARSPETPQ